MANGSRSFKSDESFLEKISIGAIGTKKVFNKLIEQGHRPIELERGSMSYKIWKSIKIKRIRVPDLLCVNCGIRIESRAKTKLEITMSHSKSDKERSWDFGLNNEDYVALVKCKKSGERPIDWEASDFIQYIKVSHLRDTYKKKLINEINPKGAEEGFESRITWSSAISSSNGKISDINTAKKRIQFKRLNDDRTISLSLLKKDIEIQPLVNIGDKISENEIIASVVPIVKYFQCKPKVSENHYISLFQSKSLSERYAAAKSLSYFKIKKEALNSLIHTLNDSDEHIYIRLESAATLSRNNVKDGYKFIEDCLKSGHPVDKLEAIIVLGEINTKNSFKLLAKCLLDNNQHPEIRAGAAWSLGELGHKGSLPILIESFNAIEKSIKIEAARSLAKLSQKNCIEILNKLPKVNSDQKQGIAWAAAKAKGFSINNLLPNLTDKESRQWIAYILGMQNKEDYFNDIEKLKNKDPEVYFAVTVLWKILSSWIYGLEEY